MKWKAPTAAVAACLALIRGYVAQMTPARRPICSLVHGNSFPTLRIRSTGPRSRSKKVDWAKSGLPLTVIGPVISPFSAALSSQLLKLREEKTATMDYRRPLRRLRDMTLPSRGFVSGFGTTPPAFHLLEQFVKRVGSEGYFCTSTYTGPG